MLSKQYKPSRQRRKRPQTSLGEPRIPATELECRSTSSQLSQNATSNSDLVNMAFGAEAGSLLCRNIMK